jgi:hypothetical protein
MTQDLLLRAPAQEDPSVFGLIHELLRQHGRLAGDDLDERAAAARQAPRELD